MSLTRTVMSDTLIRFQLPGHPDLLICKYQLDRSDGPFLEAARYPGCTCFTDALEVIRQWKVGDGFFSYAHLFGNGDIKRKTEVIGHRSDLVEVPPQ